MSKRENKGTPDNEDEVNGSFDHKITMPSETPKFHPFGKISTAPADSKRIQSIKAENKDYVRKYIKALDEVDEKHFPFVRQLRATIDEKTLIPRMSQSIIDTGAYHEAPKTQKFLTNLLWVLILGAQLSELGFTGTEASQTNNPLFLYPFQKAPVLLTIVLAILAAIAAFYNWHSVSRKQASKRYNGTIQLGKKLLRPCADKFIEAKDEKGDIQFIIDPEFDPRSGKYNSRKVRFFLYANRKLYDYEYRHRNHKAEKSIPFTCFNTAAFWLSNILGGATNGGAAGEALIKYSPLVRFIAGPTIGFASIVVGSTFYLVFAGKTVEKANEVFLTYKDPYRQLWNISSAQSSRDLGRGILYAVSRGATFGTNAGYLMHVGERLFRISIPSGWKTGIVIASIGIGGFNTFITRTKAIDRSLRAFQVPNPFKQDMLVPDPTLHPAFLREVGITPESPFTCETIAKIGAEAIFDASATSGAIMLLMHYSEAPLVYTIPLVGSVFIIRAILHCFAERSALQQEAFSKQTRAYISSEEEKKPEKYDCNGNKILTKKDPAAERTATFFTLVDQFLRWSSRILLASYWEQIGLPPIGPWWVTYVTVALLTLDPQKNEYYFYREQVELEGAINYVRELAAMPFNKLVERTMKGDHWCCFTAAVAVILNVPLSWVAAFFVRLLPCWFGELQSHPSFKEPIALSIQDSRGKRTLNDSSTFNRPGITNGDLEEPLLPLNGASSAGDLADQKEEDKEQHGGNRPFKPLRLIGDLPDDEPLPRTMMNGSAAETLLNSGLDMKYGSR